MTQQRTPEQAGKTLGRYTSLLWLCKHGVANDAEKAEFYEICAEMLTELMTENSDIFMRLKAR